MKRVTYIGGPMDGCYFNADENGVIQGNLVIVSGARVTSTIMNLYERITDANFDVQYVWEEKEA